MHDTKIIRHSPSEEKATKRDGPQNILLTPQKSTKTQRIQDDCNKIRVSTQVTEECRTPSTLLQSFGVIRPFTQTEERNFEQKQSKLGPTDDVEQTEKKSQSNVRQIRIENLETGARRYLKLLDSTKTHESSQHNNEDAKNLDVEHKKEQDYHPTTTTFTKKANSETLPKNDDSSQRSSEEYINQKKRKLFNETPMYVANKKLKYTSNFFRGNIKLYDKLTENFIDFRVFRESDLGHGKILQATLKDTKIDDDCPTDDDQIELAVKHVRKQLFQAVRRQNSNSESNSKTTSTSFNSRSFSVRDSNQGYYSAGLSSEDSYYSRSQKKISVCLDSAPKGIDKVMKKLSYTNSQSDSNQGTRSLEKTDIPSNLYFDDL